MVKLNQAVKVALKSGYNIHGKLTMLSTYTRIQRITKVYMDGSFCTDSGDVWIGVNSEGFVY